MIDQEQLIQLALAAGEAVMEIYAGPVEVTAKEDQSPLTLADRRAHGMIEERLRELDPDTPLLSEEGREIPFAERRGWTRFWLVDPLDGTKEFIKKNGEFTINIALIEGGYPVWGVVNAPALGRCWFGGRGLGAYHMEGGTRTPITVRPRPEGGLTAVKSRSHPSAELEAFYSAIHIEKEVAVGSSLKFCVVAQGEADLYARLGPTMEWDTAAGQAVVEGAGGRVVTLDGHRLVYNKEELRNPHFIADSGPA